MAIGFGVDRIDRAGALVGTRQCNAAVQDAETDPIVWYRCNLAAAGHHGATALAVRVDRGRLTLATTGDDGTSGMDHVSIHAPSAKRSEFAC